MDSTKKFSFCLCGTLSQGVYRVHTKAIGSHWGWLSVSLGTIRNRCWRKSTVGYWGGRRNGKSWWGIWCSQSTGRCTNASYWGSWLFIYNTCWNVESVWNKVAAVSWKLTSCPWWNWWVPPNFLRTESIWDKVASLCIELKWTTKLVPCLWIWEKTRCAIVMLPLILIQNRGNGPPQTVNLWELHSLHIHPRLEKCTI